MKKQLKLLLVDDEKEFVETLAARLEMRDLSARVALDGQEALAKIEEEEPDVIVLDLKMPGMHGIEVLRRVKQAYPHVEVIILTGHGSQEDEEAARSLGAFNYLPKPVDLDRLFTQVGGAFKKRLRTLESLSMAATFAEAGDFDTARSIMEEEDGGKKKKKQKKADEDSSK